MSGRTVVYGRGARLAMGPGEKPSPAHRPSTGLLLVTKLFSLLLLLGASGLLYHVAASQGFRIETVVVSGSQLVPPAEIERAAAVTGLNIFWIREEEVSHRLQAVPGVQAVRARTVLPNRLEVRIVERVPVAGWNNGGTTYLVDAEGRVLGSTDRSVILPTMQDMGTQPLQAGGMVDRAALNTMFQLQQLLPRLASVSPKSFEYSPDIGVTIVADSGLRARFGRDDDLEWKVGALVAVRRELERQGQRPELIDLRFRDRPYAR